MNCRIQRVEVLSFYFNFSTCDNISSYEIVHITMEKILFLYCLFMNNVSTSNSLMLNDRTVPEQVIGKDVKGSTCGLISGIILATD